MRLEYTTDYVWEDGLGISYNIEIETTFDVTPGKSGSFEHPPEGPEINNIFVKVLHIEGVVDSNGFYGKVGKAINTELWEDIARDFNIDLIEKVYSDVAEWGLDRA